MVYTMEIYVDGGCRGNGKPWAFGAAAAAFKKRNGTFQGWYRALPSTPRPTSQRAEITAIILALQQVLAKHKELFSDPWLDVTIYSDSRYAVGCMTEWIYKWSKKGWVNSQGGEVANRDLIQWASNLDDQVKELGDVTYLYIPRAQNDYADDLCKQCLDEQE
ncbi:ribonuclease H-like domain-containing protein [Aspergillus pseudodeflectus]|uniref:ribonuclease H n=1 Tax=Aspergillus pseudodeflectus TaxID=176178 RepID=A0ABR4JEW1_9EURO